jgi:NADH-quinone oxidoreductase subunit I
MTKAYDFSEFELSNMNYHFSDLSPEQAEEKKKVYEAQQAAKLAAKQAAKPEVEAFKPEEGLTPTPPPAKPAIKRPMIKPVIKKQDPPSGE